MLEYFGVYIVGMRDFAFSSSLEQILWPTTGANSPVNHALVRGIPRPVGWLAGRWRGGKSQRKLTSTHARQRRAGHRRPTGTRIVPLNYALENGLNEPLLKRLRDVSRSDRFHPPMEFFTESIA